MGGGEPKLHVCPECIAPTSSQAQKPEAGAELQDRPGQPRHHKNGAATLFNYSALRGVWGSFLGPDSSFPNGMGAHFPFLLLGGQAGVAGIVYTPQDRALGPLRPALMCAWKHSILRVCTLKSRGEASKPAGPRPDSTALAGSEGRAQRVPRSTLTSTEMRSFWPLSAQAMGLGRMQWAGSRYPLPPLKLSCPTGWHTRAPPSCKRDRGQPCLASHETHTPLPGSSFSDSDPILTDQ